MRQAQALQVMMSGQSVFLTGPPGSGKTYILRKFIEAQKKANRRLAITASTGIAATHIGGTTIHSWSGLGIRDSVDEHDAGWLKDNDRLLKRYNNTDVLIIDEVSMLHGKRLDMLNQVCKWLRDSDQPFGGLQVIVTGDLFQLPPINRSNEAVDFAHTSAAWTELNPQICYLSEQHRQVGDQLLDVLEAMRRGEVEDAHFVALEERLNRAAPDGVALTKLFAHNVDVEAINATHLTQLVGKVHVFTAQTSGRRTYIEQLQKSILAPGELLLKIGAEVMFVVNNFAEGFVNGSRGKVVEFTNGQPVVELQQNRRRVTVEPHNWIMEEDGRERARLTQLPLRLAWAITIHKSQGMSLDSAEIDLSRAFAPGMGYVALSRVRSIDGVFLRGINNMALAMHPEIFTFDIWLKQTSDELAATLPEESATSATEQTVASSLDENLLAKLKIWRITEGNAQHVPLYIIASNKTLAALATNKPTTSQQLKTVSGIGPKSAERYGDALSGLIRTHLDLPPELEASEHRPLAAKTQKILTFLQRRGVVLDPKETATLQKLLNGE